MQVPNWGEEVVITALLPTGQLEVAAGSLAPELDGEGKLVGLVLETDGGAAFFAPSTIVKLEVM